MCLPANADKEEDLSWFDYCFSPRLSADGKLLVFAVGGEGGADMYSVYARNTDGSDAARLGDGDVNGLSPDGKWVLALCSTDPPCFDLLPLKSDEKESLANPEGLHYQAADWFPDGRLLIQARGAAGGSLLYVQDRNNGEKPKAITPEGFRIGPVSPDGKFVAATGSDGKKVIISVDGGKPKPMPALSADDELIGWGEDSIFVAHYEGAHAVVKRFDPATGKSDDGVKIAPADPTGIVAVTSIQITPDGKSYAYRYFRILSDLYWVEGLN